MNAPKMKLSIDWTPLIQQLEQYREFIESDDFHEDNDFKAYIYESAITCAYGNEWWPWIRSVMQ